MSSYFNFVALQNSPTNLQFYFSFHGAKPMGRFLSGADGVDQF
jgi:hypothetical protein